MSILSNSEALFDRPQTLWDFFRYSEILNYSLKLIITILAYCGHYYHKGLL